MEIDAVIWLATVVVAFNLTLLALVAFWGWAFRAAAHRRRPVPGDTGSVLAGTTLAVRGGLVLVGPAWMTRVPVMRGRPWLNFLDRPVFLDRPESFSTVQNRSGFDAGEGCRRCCCRQR